MKVILIFSAILLLASSLTLRHDDICTVSNQWGGSSAPWNPAGTWTLGNRPAQEVQAIHIKSNDNGKTFSGTMTYINEGPIGFKATWISENNYAVQNQWGGNYAPWHDGGRWVIGDRNGQRIIAVDVDKNSSGELVGTAHYQNEGPIGFKADCK